MITLAASLFIGVCIGYAAAFWRQQSKRHVIPVEIGTERPFDTLDVLLNTERRALDRRPN